MVYGHLKCCVLMWKGRYLKSDEVGVQGPSEFGQWMAMQVVELLLPRSLRLLSVSAVLAYIFDS
jgi:hypothetical protein